MPMAMRRVRAIIPLAIILSALGAGIWYWLSHRQSAPAQGLTLYGNVDIREVDVAFRDSERVASMLVTEGDAVRSGQLLATLDTGRLEPAVAQAEAQAQAQAQVVARLLAGSRPEEIAAARANAAAAEAEAVNARAAYQRAVDLASQQVVTAQRLDDATAARDAAEARLKAAQEALNLALAGPRKEDIAAAQAALKAYEAALALARRSLADAELYAPADGVVRNRILEPGDMASPQRPAYALALIDPVWVRAYVSEPDLGRIWPGMRAEVATDSYPDKRYAGWVGYISPTAEFTPKAVETREVRTNLVYQVRVYVHNPAGELRLGMPATVTIQLDQPRTAGSDHGDAE
jgi:HlyD family secretion protein